MIKLKEANIVLLHLEKTELEKNLFTGVNNTRIRKDEEMIKIWCSKASSNYQIRK
jgi:hypothetical protein